jgi:hypothetical protein
VSTPISGGYTAATPIMEFKDVQEAVASLKEWQICLGLTDWIIKVCLCEPCDLEMENVAGECSYVTVNKTAVIRILQPRYYGDRIVKYCAEKTLVHELLHCKLALLDTNNDGFNTVMHQTHEDLAKALIMAKYNVTLDFFNNIHYEEDEARG